MAKRTIATVRQLINEVNSILPTAPKMSFRKKGMDRYVLVFEGITHDREFGPLSCGETCEFINGIIYARMETKEIIKDHPTKGAYLSMHLYADNQTAAAEAYKAEVQRTKERYEQRIVENAKGLHDMFLRASAAEEEITKIKNSNGAYIEHLEDLLVKAIANINTLPIPMTVTEGVAKLVAQHNGAKG